MDKRHGFTLTELLVVIAMISLLSVLASPALNSLLGTGNFHSSVTEMGDLLEEAHAAALANNTYVWVGFMQMPNNAGVGMAFVYSPTGNPSYFLPVSGVTPPSLCKPVVLRNVNLTTIAGNALSAPGRATQSVGQLFGGDNVLTLLNANGQAMSAQFSAPIGGTAQTITAGNTQPFNSVLEITPSGQVVISAADKYAWIEIGLAPIRSAGKDLAVIQMNSFTGRVAEFFP